MEGESWPGRAVYLETHSNEGATRAGASPQPWNRHCQEVLSRTNFASLVYSLPLAAIEQLQ